MTISSEIKNILHSEYFSCSPLSRNLACKHVVCKAINSRMLTATLEQHIIKTKRQKNKMTFMSSDKGLGNKRQFLPGSSRKWIAWMRQFLVSLILVSEKRSISHDSVLYRKKPTILCFESFIVRFLMGGGIND